MQVFHCPTCSTPLYFDNDRCTCGQEIAFDPETQTMIPASHRCANYPEIACNWPPETDGFCRSCAMTETVPDLRTPDNMPLWARTEAAKRWMLANLGRWGWFTADDTGARPIFRLLSEETATGEAEVTMGHADGTITINVTEAHAPIRAERQAQLGELYRTMLGHMRHEIAHFLFVRLCSGTPAFLDGFRAVFGDEQADYAKALQRHYETPGVADESHVTAYATAHPHEDWAETVAHLLHLIDIADSATAAGLTLPNNGPVPGYDAYAEEDTSTVLDHAVRLSLAITHVNRALDLPDLYPFVLAQGVRKKLTIVHQHLRVPTSG
jgi:hypothetical protein